jgi:hypothetical protein
MTWPRVLRTAGPLLATVALLAACGGSHSYPANVQANFLNACEANGGDVSSCGCALKWFESHRSLTQFMADDDQANNGGTPPDMLKASAACGG